jgi:hypothetical protein
MRNNRTIMNKQLRRVWGDAVGAYFKYYSGNCMEWFRSAIGSSNPGKEFLIKKA